MSNFLLSIILSYLVGSFPSAYVIGKIFYNKNVLELGSKNVGTTNAYRVLGPIPAIFTMVIDILKGTLGSFMPVLLGIGDRHFMLYIGFAAVLGHSFSIFLRFKGGKAVATSAGILLAYNPLLFIMAFATFVTLVLLTSTVSFSSLTTLTLLSIISLFGHDTIFSVIAILVTIFIFIRHIPNIKRLIHGNENILNFGLLHYLKNK
ncbi:glycerol-3-phosphate acyltransferase [Companilactobacillus sp. RD055328]|uniref:glycerol-3-phosphate 1-O-acyltransferase PlsY n=1 Tax=Companilactobacillus sp. RD055328 TaxID=2916634 RepID=UPI001FC8C513|nr:glycerol-3-phosphate 1-O-acyltransferase PlsY [Companilactobacillus sp. RD055328]GKQ42713.1 glycerol-3-phosphate acyltransferase [Companilactobacillus sp. RD055328]